jgi:protein farnesyltransferase/geranylgeranyltransferase type-1 subunit alpha
MDHFRAVSASGEKSERALELTETIIRMNPAHYTIWYVVRLRYCKSVADGKELPDADPARAQEGFGGRIGIDE